MTLFLPWFLFWATLYMYIYSVMCLCRVSADVERLNQVTCHRCHHHRHHSVLSCVKTLHANYLHAYASSAWLAICHLVRQWWSMSLLGYKDTHMQKNRQTDRQTDRQADRKLCDTVTPCAIVCSSLVGGSVTSVITSHRQRQAQIDKRRERDRELHVDKRHRCQATDQSSASSSLSSCWQAIVYGVIYAYPLPPQFSVTISQKFSQQILANITKSSSLDARFDGQNSLNSILFGAVSQPPPHLEDTQSASLTLG